MKRKSFSIFWGVMFVLGGFVGLAKYGVFSALICFIIGILFLIPFKVKSDPQEEAVSGTGDKPHYKNIAFYRDTKSNSFSVAGVTFSNESGEIKSRQTILRRLLFNDPPFDCDCTVTLERYIYENEPAFYVKVNDYIIGNVPKEFIPFIDVNFDRPYRIDDFQVYGGQDGKKFGASLKLSKRNSCKKRAALSSRPFIIPLSFFLQYRLYSSISITFLAS